MSPVGDAYDGRDTSCDTKLALIIRGGGFLHSLAAQSELPLLWQYSVVQSRQRLAMQEDEWLPWLIRKRAGEQMVDGILIFSSGTLLMVLTTPRLSRVPGRRRVCCQLLSTEMSRQLIADGTVYWM